MKILVAGGAGFIGTNLCLALLNLGHEVTCVDNLISGSMDNVNLLSESTHFHFYGIGIEKFETKDTYDVIFNLACIASPKLYSTFPLWTLDACFNGTCNLLNIAKASRAKFIQASTSEIYGKPLITPQPENYYGYVNSMGPRSCYDEGKRVAETLCYEYKKFQDVRVVRIFNTYGPYMQKYDGRVIPTFIEQMRSNEPITINDGNQTRSFMYIDDLIEALLKVMECEPYSGAINLGNPEEHTIVELADTIAELLGIEHYQKVIKTLPQDDPKQRKPDITKAKKLLNWEPKISLREGLTKYINFINQK